MIIRNFILSIMSAAVCLTVSAADCTMPVAVSVKGPDNSLNEANAALLTNKLTQVVAGEGFGGSETAWLCLSADVSEIQKDIISGMRPVVSTNLDVYLTIFNVITGDKYGATSISLKGSGASDARSYQAALAQINTSNHDLLEFVRNAHAKLMSFYEGHVPAIIRNARTLASREEFEKALAILSTIPECVDGHEEAADAMIEIWLRYVNIDCERKVATARSIWATGKSPENARKAAALLAAIHPDSSCKDAANELLKEMESTLDAETARQLALEAEERAYKRSREEDELNIRRYQLESAREISLAYINALIEMSKNAPAAAPATPPAVSPAVAPDADMSRGGGSHVIIVK